MISDMGFPGAMVVFDTIYHEKFVSYVSGMRKAMLQAFVFKFANINLFKTLVGELVARLQSH